MSAALSFEQAPPISVPYRFFLTAPWFAVLAGLTFALQAEDALASRWSPAALTLTHLLTVGFMLQAMTGALLQFVPVAAGGNVWRPRLVAALVHPALSVGALVLAAAFMTGDGDLFRFAFLLLVSAILLLVAVVGHALWRTPAGGDTLPALRLAVAALAVAALLGGVLALAEGGIGKHWTDLHAFWALGGWAFVLLAGVSWTVVPMFQLTPPYPRRLVRWLPPLALSLTLAVSVTSFLSPAVFRGLLVGAGALAGWQALATLHLQGRRRRKLRDASLLGFQAAMLCLLLAGVLLAVGSLWPWLLQDRLALGLGVLLLPGAFGCAIAGMLYKIVPFVGWLHLQHQSTAAAAPGVRALLGEAAMRRQSKLQLIALVLLLLTLVWPLLAVPAGLTFAGASAWLGINIAHAARRVAGHAGG